MRRLPAARRPFDDKAYRPTVHAPGGPGSQVPDGIGGRHAPLSVNATLPGLNNIYLLIKNLSISRGRAGWNALDRARLNRLLPCHILNSSLHQLEDGSQFRVCVTVLLGSEDRRTFCEEKNTCVCLRGACTVLTDGEREEAISTTCNEGFLAPPFSGGLRDGSLGKDLRCGIAVWH